MNTENQPPAQNTCATQRVKCQVCGKCPLCDETIILNRTNPKGEIGEWICQHCTQAELKEFKVEVLQDKGKPKVFTVSASTELDAIQIALAADNGWGGVLDARGILELAKAFCRVL